MRKYKLVDKTNEEITFKTLLSSVRKNISLNNINNFHINDVNEILNTSSSLSDNADNGVYTIRSENEQKYTDGSRYNRGDMVRYHGQLFMANPNNPEDLTTDTIPSMYSQNWIALSDNQCEKLVWWDKSPEELDNHNLINFGNILNNLPTILRKGQFYDYFNDGDYYILNTSNGHTYTMRLNYNEWIDNQGITYASVDAISDEVIPNIQFNVPKIFEGENTKYLSSLYGVGLTTVFNTVFEELKKYRDINLQNRISWGIESPYIKWRNYYGYYRQLPIEKGGTYNSSLSNQYYLHSLDDITKKRINEVPNIWLPIEQEVFGLTYNSCAPSVEASFKQYTTLNTAFKRCKTLNGLPVPWMTMSVYKNDVRPIIVDVFGNEVNYALYDQNGGFNESIYVPLCVTLLTVEKSYT
jgi:hypothetical protein